MMTLRPHEHAYLTRRGFPTAPAARDRLGYVGPLLKGLLLGTLVVPGSLLAEIGLWVAGLGSLAVLFWSVGKWAAFRYLIADYQTAIRRHERLLDDDAMAFDPAMERWVHRSEGRVWETRDRLERELFTPRWMNGFEDRPRLRRTDMAVTGLWLVGLLAVNAWVVALLVAAAVVAARRATRFVQTVRFQYVVQIGTKTGDVFDSQGQTLGKIRYAVAG